jgi:uncharacterized protein (TIGR01244 family)
MWPFKTHSESKMNYRKIDQNFAVSGQVLPQQLGDVAAAGFKTIVCARPDGEEPGQPGFAAIEQAARANGLQAIHIPVSGGINKDALDRMEEALKTMPGPMFGYCRSGGRAETLYVAARQAQRR